MLFNRAPSASAERKSLALISFRKSDSAIDSGYFAETEKAYGIEL